MAYLANKDCKLLMLKAVYLNVLKYIKMIKIAFYFLIYLMFLCIVSILKWKMTNEKYNSGGPMSSWSSVVGAGTFLPEISKMLI